MDTLYTGDIPSDYHYALFNNGYVDLYNTDVLHNNNYDFYRVYTNSGGFFYRRFTTSVGQYTTTYTENINISSNPCYRSDFAYIMIMVFIFTLFGVWLFNIFTSLINKGGLLGGLL